MISLRDALRTTEEPGRGPGVMMIISAVPRGVKLTPYAIPFLACMAPAAMTWCTRQSIASWVRDPPLVHQDSAMPGSKVSPWTTMPLFERIVLPETKLWPARSHPTCHKCLAIGGGHDLCEERAAGRAIMAQCKVLSRDGAQQVRVDRRPAARSAGPSLDTNPQSRIRVDARTGWGCPPL